ncbi:MAG: flavodoxin [Bacillota bacterium]
MAKVGVVYWSGTGNTKAMADAIIEGAKAAGAEVSDIPVTEFTRDSVGSYDTYAFGCPSMGAEVLEEAEFQPMWDDVKEALRGKNIVLFGSYGWGDGEWMRNWVAECEDIGLNVIENYMANEAPDDAAVATCKDLGAKLA